MNPIKHLLAACLPMVCSLFTGCGETESELSARDAINEFGHRGHFIAEAFDEERIAIGGDGLIVVNRVDDRLIWRFALPQQPNPSLDCVAWSPDGKYLAAALKFGPVIVWNSKSWQEVGKSGKADRTLTITWRGNMIVAVRETERRFEVEQWSVADSGLRREITAAIGPLPKAYVTQAEFLADADRLLISTGYKVFLAQWQGGVYETSLIHTNDDGIYAWDYCPKNESLAYVMIYGQVMLLPISSEAADSAETADNAKELAYRNFVAQMIKVSDDGKLLAVAGYSERMSDLSRIDVLRVESGEVVHSHELGATLVNMLWSDYDTALRIRAIRPESRYELIDVPIPVK